MKVDFLPFLILSILFFLKKKNVGILIRLQSYWYLEMEHGSFSDHSKSTFSLSDEDHTLANSIRFTLNQELVLLKLLFSV